MKLKREVVKRKVEDSYYWLELDDEEKEFLKDVIFKFEDKGVYLTGITYNYNRSDINNWKTPDSLTFNLRDPVKIK